MWELLGWLVGWGWVSGMCMQCWTLKLQIKFKKLGPIQHANVARIRSAVHLACHLLHHTGCHACKRAYEKSLKGFAKSMHECNICKLRNHWISICKSVQILGTLFTLLVCLYVSRILLLHVLARRTRSPLYQISVIVGIVWFVLSDIHLSL